MRKRGQLRESGKRSKLEDDFASILNKLDVQEQYEVVKLDYVVPESEHKYIVDFTLPNGIHIECKGYLRDYDERHKYQLIKEQHPEIDLRFCFANPNKPVSGTKMTHATWAEKQGFLWCSIKDTDIIASWTKEKQKRKTSASKTSN